MLVAPPISNLSRKVPLPLPPSARPPSPPHHLPPHPLTPRSNLLGSRPTRRDLRRRCQLSRRSRTLILTSHRRSHRTHRSSQRQAPRTQRWSWSLPNLVPPVANHRRRLHLQGVDRAESDDHIWGRSCDLRTVVSVISLALCSLLLYAVGIMYDCMIEVSETQMNEVILMMYCDVRFRVLAIYATADKDRSLSAVHIPGDM